jgi:acyl-CoA thioester hydrolase
MTVKMNTPPDAAYPHWDTITTRWMDNDMYGHVNNVQYYSFFDTAVTTWLVTEGGLDPRNGQMIGLCVESQCTFAAPLSFPDKVLAGLRVGHVGRSSVRYEIVLYAAGSGRPAASGHFVHVYVDRASRRPTAIPHSLLGALSALVTVPVDGAAGSGLDRAG